MDATSTDSRSHRHTWSIHVILLLHAIGAGVGLIYWLQPPKPTGALVYELTLVTSEKPINDFPLQLTAIQQRPPGRLTLARTEMYGSIQLSSTPGQVTQFQLAPLPGQITTYLGPTGFDFELRGDLIGDRVRTHLIIVDNDTKSSHHFELREGQYRVAVVTHGKDDSRPCCYAIIKVSRVKPPPIARFKARNPQSIRQPKPTTKSP